MLIVSATQFKLFNRSRDRKRGIGLRKQMLAPPEQVSGNGRMLRFTISTGAIDREKDAISLQGWDLRNFKRNPVVLWGHDSGRLPIGRALDVRVEGDALKATVEFIPADIPEAGEFADAVYRLAQQGFIAATSVGFRPIEWSYSTDPARGADDWFPGIDFEQQELVELSVVTVPANPEALIEPQQMQAPAIPGEIASDTPPASGEELTEIDAHSVAAKQEQARMRARRRRVLQLVQVSLEAASFR